MMSERHNWEPTWILTTVTGRYRAGFKCRACGKESRTESQRAICLEGNPIQPMTAIVRQPKIRAEARRRLFGSTHCWKCDRPPTAQHNGTPYCSIQHHPDPMKRGSTA